MAAPGEREKKFAILIHDRVAEGESSNATVMYSYESDDSVWFPICVCSVDYANEIADAFYAQKVWIAHGCSNYEHI